MKEKLSTMLNVAGAVGRYTFLGPVELAKELNSPVDRSPAVITISAAILFPAANMARAALGGYSVEEVILTGAIAYGLESIGTGLFALDIHWSLHMGW